LVFIGVSFPLGFLPIAYIHSSSLPFVPHSHFNFDLEYAIRKVWEIQVGLKLNGTHHIQAYVDDVNLLGDNIESIKRK
jgi:hypothetical protein